MPAHLLRRLVPVAAVAAGLTLTTLPASAAADACPNAGAPPTAENVAAVRAALLCLHNQVRASNHAPPLKENSKLRKAALGHSAAMVDQGFFDHTGRNGDTFVDRVLGAGYARRTDPWTLGENIAWGIGEPATPGGAMQGWMNSRPHRANILRRTYREIGIGIRLGVPSDPGAGATITADFGAKV